MIRLYKADGSGHTDFENILFTGYTPTFHYADVVPDLDLITIGGIDYKISNAFVANNSQSTASMLASTIRHIGTMIVHTVDITPLQASSNSIEAVKVAIHANINNTSYVTIGGADVEAARGMHTIAAGETIFFEIDNVNKLYFVSDTASQEISVTPLN